MGFFIFDYIVSFIVLLVIKAPWWAWLLYVGSALFWLAVGALSDGESGNETTSNHKNESQ
jgi:hypothetical protein